MILSTLNDERNRVEHDYQLPTHARAQEALDVVRLWLLATRRLSEFVVHESLAGWRADQTLGVVQLNPTLGLLSFFKVTGPSKVDEVDGKPYNFLMWIRMSNGSLVEGVEIDPEPLCSVELTYRNRAKWRPLLRPVVALSGFRHGVDSAVVRPGGVVASIRVTLPLAEEEGILEQIRSNTKGRRP